jgi:O-antigen/teichoic acid export membrane protein
MLALFLGVLAQNLVGMLWCAAQLGVWRPRLDWALIAPSLRFALYQLPSSLGAYMSLFTGKYLLGRFESLDRVGVYEATQRTATAAYLFLEPLRTATTPLLFEKYKQEGFARQWNFLVWIHLLALAGLVICFSVFSREVVLALVGAKYQAYSYMVFPLVLVAAFQHISTLGALNIYLAHKPQYDTFIEIGAGLFNVALCLALIVPWGIHGALLAAVLTYAVRCGLHVLAGNRLYPALRLSRPLLAAAGGLCVMLLGAHYLLANVPLFIRAGLCAVELTAVVALVARCNGIRLRELPGIVAQMLRLKPAQTRPPPVS